MPPQQAATFGDRNNALQIGYNHGPINNTFHCSHYSSSTTQDSDPAQSASGNTVPLKPSHTIPFPRDADGFVDRPPLMRQLASACRRPGSRAALAGLAGIGKTQLAVEFAYRSIQLAERRARPLWVFWIHADSRQSFWADFESMAAVVGIQGFDSPGANARKLVREWLRLEINTEWLLIVDGADACREIFAADGHQNRRNTAWANELRSCLPQVSHGRILITTRNTKIARLLGVRQNNIISVDSMDTTTGLSLLRKNCTSNYSDETATSLLQALDGIPLAITQAAADIEKRQQRGSVEQFLEDFERSDRTKVSMLKHDEGDLRRYESDSNSVVELWQDCLFFIHRDRPQASSLLSIFAFCDGSNIAPSLIVPPPHSRDSPGGSDLGDRDEDLDLTADYVENEEEDESSDGAASNVSCTSVSTRQRNLDDNIQYLIENSLISQSEQGAPISIKGLVQLAVRDWLKENGDFDKFHEAFISLLNDAFPKAGFRNWEKCEELFGLVRLAMKSRPNDELAIQEWSVLMYNGGYFALERGEHGLAVELARNSFGGWRNDQGTGSPQSRKSEALLGRALYQAGLWREAEAMLNSVLQRCKDCNQNEHPRTLRIMADLASAYRGQGQWDKAEVLGREVLDKRRQLLGADHLDTLTSESDLASTYWYQGRFEEAEKMDVRVLRLRTEKLGTRHPDTLSSMVNLAATFGPDRQRQALAIFSEVLVVSREVLGRAHPDTITAAHHVASIYRDQKRWKKAEKIFSETLEDGERQLGPNHPSTLGSMANLVTTYSHQGKWRKAADLGKPVLRTRTEVLGRDHPDTLRSMETLAMAHWHLNQLKEAEDLEVEVLELCRKNHMREPLRTFESMENLAHTRYSQGRLGEAVRLLEENLQLRSETPNLKDAGEGTVRETLAEWRDEQALLL